MLFSVNFNPLKSMKIHYKSMKIHENPLKSTPSLSPFSMKSRLLHGALLQLGGSKDVVDRLTSALERRRAKMGRNPLENPMEQETYVVLTYIYICTCYRYYILYIMYIILSYIYRVDIFDRL
jgi:hypothetical protein